MLAHVQRALPACLQFDPSTRHLPFMGEGKCDEPVHDAKTGFTHVHCLGPAQPLAPGEVLSLALVSFPGRVSRAVVLVF